MSDPVLGQRTGAGPVRRLDGDSEPLGLDDL